MNSYDELIIAIRALTEKGPFDYIIAIGTIALPVIAIIISIYTLIRQNKIALFDKRYHVLMIIKLIIEFSNASSKIEKSYIENKKQHGESYALAKRSYLMSDVFNTLFEAKIDNCNKDANEQWDSFLLSLYTITKELLMIEYLFSPEIDKLIDEITDEMVYYIEDTLYQNKNSSHQNLFYTKCTEFETKWFSKLQKKVRIR